MEREKKIKEENKWNRLGFEGVVGIVEEKGILGIIYIKWK